MTGVAAAVETYDSELISIRGVLDGGFTNAGTGFVGAFIATPASPADNVRFRVPVALNETLDLEQGCDVTVGPSPMWRLNTQAQVSAWVAGDVSINSCPAPRVVSAAASSSTSVLLTYSRNLATASVNANGSQFTFDNGLTASAAAVTGKTVTLTTTAQAAQTYTVTTAATVTDSRGTPVASPGTATFTGVPPGTGVCMPSVVISALYTAGGNNGATYKSDFVELHNRTNAPVTMTNWTIQYGTGAGTANFAVKATINATIPAGGYYLVVATEGSSGTSVPVTGDLSPAVDLGFGAANGIVALASSATPINCGNTTTKVDLVGYGTATCNETTSTTALSVTTAAFRNNDRCQDVNNNSTDFGVSAVNGTAPRNSATMANVCTCN